MEQKDFYSVFMRFIESEKTKIEIDKWNHGTEIHKDPGDNYVLDWIVKHAPWFRNAWEDSKCKTCIHWKWCGWKVENDCKGYINDSKSL